MAGIFGGHVRRLAAAAIVASLLGAAPSRLVAERAGACGGRTAAAVFAPRAPASLRSVDGGARLWIVQELRRDGVPVIDPGHTDEVAARHLAPDHLFLQGADTKALARETEAKFVLLTQITVLDGQLELWIRAYDRKGDVLGGRPRQRPHRRARRGAGGRARPRAERARRAADAGEAPPRLSELGSYERALERLSAGSLASAWRELEAIQSPTATPCATTSWRMSAAAGRARAGALAPREPARRLRSRLARGARIRSRSERNALVLLAGAEHATAGTTRTARWCCSRRLLKSRSPSNLDAVRGRARALVTLERNAEAKAAFERVLELAPGTSRRAWRSPATRRSRRPTGEPLGRRRRAPAPATRRRRRAQLLRARRHARRAAPRRDAPPRRAARRGARQRRRRDRGLRRGLRAWTPRISKRSRASAARARGAATRRARAPRSRRCSPRRRRTIPARWRATAKSLLAEGTGRAGGAAARTRRRARAARGTRPHRPRPCAHRHRQAGRCAARARSRAGARARTAR